MERIRRRQLEFTADASHELRTPVSVIEAEAELALSTPRSAAGYRESLHQVIGESRRLRRIIEDMLWLARFDSQPPPPGEEFVDLALIADQCAARFRAVADTRSVRLVIRHDITVLALVKAPPEWIDRLLGVLIDNACRYSPPGGTVTVRTEVTGPRVRVAVEDDGAGIPEHERERLFDRFHRATSEPGGAGLGLPIADAVVRSTGGIWHITNHPAGGRACTCPGLAGLRKARSGNAKPADPTETLAIHRSVIEFASTGGEHLFGSCGIPLIAFRVWLRSEAASFE